MRKGRAMAELFKLKSTPFDLDAQAERVYQEYPRKIGKGDALTKIRAAIKAEGFDKIHEAVLEFARACKATRREKQYIPHPSTWFNQKRWKDDRDEWWLGAQDIEAKAAYERLIKFAKKHGLRHPPVDDPDFTRAKNVAKLCNGGWAGFCDGKVTEREFVAAWKMRK